MEQYDMRNGIVINGQFYAVRKAEGPVACRTECNLYDYCRERHGRTSPCIIFTHHMDAYFVKEDFPHPAPE